MPMMHVTMQTRTKCSDNTIKLLYKMKKPLVLIVDDIPQNIQVLISILRKEDIDIIFASSGQQALTLLQTTLPDLILLDIMMPDIDGFDVCTQLKQNESTKDIPVIFLTAKSLIEDIAKGFEVGGVDYIKKPFHSVELLARIHTHLELKQSRDKIIQTNRELEAIKEELQKLSITDALTGLYNRRYFQTQLNKELSRRLRNKAHNLALIMMDIDYFKRLNDENGHLVGDQVLTKLGELAQQSFRKHDIPCRYGGEEFVVILPDTLIDQAILSAEQFRSLIENTALCIDNKTIRFTISVGVAAVGEIGIDTAQNLIKAADTALYKSKDSGRNCVSRYDDGVPC